MTKTSGVTRVSKSVRIAQVVVDLDAETFETLEKLAALYGETVVEYLNDLANVEIWNRADQVR